MSLRHEVTHEEFQKMMKGFESLKPLIIGFGYKARHGKDSVVTAIIQNRTQPYPYGRIIRMSFAKALKRELEAMAQAMGGMKYLFHLFYQANAGMYALCPDPTKPEYALVFEDSPDMTDPDMPSGKQRSMLQWHGTQFWRNLDANHWIKALEEEIKTLTPMPKAILITDMRFVNEADWIKNQGGYLVCVTRVNKDGTEFHDPAVQYHDSERDLSKYPFDYYISAHDGEMEILIKQALAVYDDIIERKARKHEEKAANYDCPGVAPSEPTIEEEDLYISSFQCHGFGL
jgi:hypothetical protein